MRIHTRLLAVMTLLLCLAALLCACSVSDVKDKVDSVKGEVDAVKDKVGAVKDEIKDKVSNLITTTSAPPTTTAVTTEAPPSPGMQYQKGSDGRSYTVRGYAGKLTDLVIAEENNGFPVTSIMQGAFKGKKNLTSIRIPDSVTSIGKGAFNGCDGMIRTDGGAKYVDRWVVGLGALDAMATLRADTVGIADAAFEGCSQLVSITLSESLRHIGKDAFLGCTSLSTIVVPEANTAFCVVGDALYTKDMTRLIRYFGKDKSFTVPATVTEIASSAFRDQKTLTSITFEEGSALVTLGEYAFSGCTSLTAFTIPSGVKRISNGAFSGCTSLATFAYPLDSVCAAIGAEAFRGCSALTSIRILTDMTEIGQNAFYECTSLGAVHFAVTEGWRAGDQDVPKTVVYASAQAATALKDTYHIKTWVRD